MTNQEYGNGKSHGRSFTLTFGMGTVVAFLLVLSLGLVSVFCLGIFLGRGYSPETALPALAALMPEPAQTAAPLIIADDVPPANPGSAPVAVPTPPVDATPSASQRPSEPAAPVTPTPTPRNVQPTPAPAPVAQTPQPPTRQPVPQQQEAQSQGERFQFSYQVASYKASEPCVALVNKLKGGGFSARMEKHEDGANTYYRTIVDFSGTTKDAENFKERLKAGGAPGIFLKGRKPLR